ncbi:hypothetical protein CPB84DRAFT_1759882 [Gymnopilus junonius]|uniref:Uncharacterized protein n=1 Tax=Gymnopilus junonius TaxID=109634 RepID=A0A9P5NXP1_GYMJU|nr:hypothetical protein CPB84DRAFT_1759882 [Gymnopilus junonius]
MSGNSPRSSSSPLSRANTSPDSPLNEQENVVTQRGLQEASVALDVAYNRIRQVRRNLLQLSETQPTLEGGTSHSVGDRDEIRPAHEALLLSGGELEEYNQGVQRAWTPPVRSMPPSPSQHSGGTDDYLPPASSLSDTTGLSGSPAFFQIPGNQESDPSTRPPRFRSRRERSPTDMQFFYRRASSPDSASTTRGLRVAAREAQGQDSSVDFHAYAAEFDRLLTRQRERMAELQRTTEARDTQRTGPVSAIPPHPLISTTPWRSPDPRRWRSFRPPNARQSSTEIMNQFEPLSSMLDRASSSDGSRPPWSTERRPPYLAHSNRETLFSEDMSNNINIDWSDDDFISWLFPEQDSHSLPPRDLASQLPTDPSANAETIRVTRTTNTTLSPAEHPPPRRGWARLDPDGNEIPENEEEELERSRTQYRLRALQQTRQSGRASGGLFQDFSRQRSMYGSVLDATLHVQEERQRSVPAHSNDSTRLYVDPLPIPLAAMVLDPETPQQNDIGVDVVIPHYACIAGR